MSLISLRATGGVSIRPDKYMRGDSARVFTIVILPLIVRVRCFQMCSRFLKAAILGLKL